MLQESYAKKSPHPLSLKPDLEETHKRWEAYWAGDMMDRPIVLATAPREGAHFVQGSTYKDRMFGDLESAIERGLHNATGTFYGGEAVPQFWLSFGCDEIAAFCGVADLVSSDAGADTYWSLPLIHDWDTAFPIQLQEDEPLWQRMLSFYRLASDRLGGQMLLMPIDFHSNMDLLLAARGAENLCLDLLDCPETIDRAMEDARAVFPGVWQALSEAGGMETFGYAHTGYSMEGVCILQCDFSALISPEMFRRWVCPALEEEAEIVRHALYHWDGPRALVHFQELMSIPGLHTFAFVPDPGERHVHYLDLYRRVQAAGKAVSVSGTLEEIQLMHRELKPEKTLYHVALSSVAEVEDLLRWFVKNT